MKIIKKYIGKEINNSGFSLVELICGISILALLGVGLVGFLSVSTRIFTRTSNEVNVQQEAQFAAGIIESIVQDSTEAPTEIIIGGVTSGFSITVKDNSYNVYIDRTNNQLMLSYVLEDGTSDTEVLATDISDFAYTYDTSTYASKKKIDLFFDFEQGSKHYRATNSASSRNGNKFTVSGEGAAIIKTSSEIVLEPNQEYDFSSPSATTVIGATNQEIRVSLIRGGGSDPTTRIDGKTLIIGKNETKPELTVKMETAATKADGTPAGTTTVKVYVRRVTGINVRGDLISGTALKSGAEYKVTAEVTGINLDKKVLLASDSDYETYHPYNYDFVFIYRDAGSVVSYDPYLEIDAPTNPYVTLAGTEATVVFRLKQDLPTFGAFSVVVGSLHPDGGNGAGVYYNKSHTNYVDTRITGIYSVSNHMYSYVPGSIERSTDQRQSQFTYRDNLLTYYRGKSGNTKTYSSGMLWRYRVVIGEDDETHMRICGPWTDWLDNNGDRDNSVAINLRKEATGIFEPALKYEIQIKLYIKEEGKDVRVDGYVWPEEDTPTAQYLIEDTIEPVSLFMKCTENDSTTLFAREAKYGSEESPMIFNNYNDYKLSWCDESLGKRYVGIDTNTEIDNGLTRVIQKKTPAGWETKFTYINGNQPLLVECRVGTNNAEQSDKYVLKEAGLYRILLEGYQIKTYRYDASKANVDERYILERRNLQFWNEGTGQGIYYFQVN